MGRDDVLVGREFPVSAPEKRGETTITDSHGLDG